MSEPLDYDATLPERPDLKAMLAECNLTDTPHEIPVANVLRMKSANRNIRKLAEWLRELERLSALRDRLLAVKDANSVTATCVTCRHWIMFDKPSAGRLGTCRVGVAGPLGYKDGPYDFSCSLQESKDKDADGDE